MPAFHHDIPIEDRLKAFRWYQGYWNVHPLTCGQCSAEMEAFEPDDPDKPPKGWGEAYDTDLRLRCPECGHTQKGVPTLVYSMYDRRDTLPDSPAELFEQIAEEDA